MECTAMAQHNWHDLLNKFSKAFLNSVTRHDYEDLSESITASGWLGYLGASEAQIAAAEARLGRSLPPSYREFLKISNGWRNWGAFIDKLWSAEEVDWFVVRNASWVGVWADGGDDLEDLPDDEYFVYGDDQDPVFMRHEHLKTALEVSDVGDSAIMLLNPQVITPDGEWEAWFFANWLPGARRYRSFWDMLHDEHLSFLEIEAQNVRHKADKSLRESGADGLITMLEDKIAQFRQLTASQRVAPPASGMAVFGVEDTTMQGYTEGNVEGMAFGLAQVQAIDAQHLDPDTLRADLKRLAGDLLRKHLDHQQGLHDEFTSDPAGILELLAGGMDKLQDQMRAAGRSQGYQMASSIIEHFLARHPE
jgi:hypothetical protein